MTIHHERFSRFTHAIVRPPASNFADGLTTVQLGVPDFALALQQHERYCMALEKHGCKLTRLPAEELYPDSTFVEDTALILPQTAAILTRPGAESRTGEVALIGDAMKHFFADVMQIQAPGTLDAGDVCETESHVFIGISLRTNEEGARKLSAWLASHGYASSTVDIRPNNNILHLKSGVTALGNGRLLAIESLADNPAFHNFEIVRVPSGDEYAANCVRVNDVVFLADGFERTHEILRSLNYSVELLDMSEFAKMDGGLSCLSLRF